MVITTIFNWKLHDSDLYQTYRISLRLDEIKCLFLPFAICSVFWFGKMDEQTG